MATYMMADLGAVNKVVVGAVVPRPNTIRN